MKVYSKIDSIPNGRASDVLTNGCLLLEGGAFRALYSQGVCDYWMLNGLNFSCTVGVSAGGLTGLAYHCGYIGRCARLNLRYRHDGRYIGLKNLIRCGSPLRLDFIFKDYLDVEPFDENLMNNPKRRFIVEATNCLTGQATFFERAKCSDIYAAIKASSTLPYISPMIEIDNEPYLDGGCVCRLPYKWALKQGYKKNVIIRTRELSFRKNEKSKNIGNYLYYNYPQLRASLEKSNAEYNQACSEVDGLAKQGDIFVVAPSKPVTVSRLEPNLEKLGDLYWLGYHDAERTFPALKEYLQK